MLHREVLETHVLLHVHQRHIARGAVALLRNDGFELVFDIYQAIDPRRLFVTPFARRPLR